MSNVKTGRVSDVILESLNRFHEAKNTGALNRNELSELIIKIGDLFANKVKQGKVSSEDIENVESFLYGFDGKNASNYFSIEHSNLDVAKRTFEEGVDFALQELQDKRLAASPKESDYRKIYQKVA